MSEASLEALANAAGIEPRYWDIHGGLHEISPAAARHLLKSLGIKCGTTADIEASLTDLRDESWRQALPPVIVARESYPINITFIPGSLQDRTIRWTVVREQGDVSSGEVRIQDLPILAERWIGGHIRRQLNIGIFPQPAGYHHLMISDGESVVAASLIVAPERCHSLSGRQWGVTAQLYSIRTRQDWGMGDFGSLKKLIDWSSRHRASMISLNPLHALFLDTPADASPYYPSSRLWVNPLYLDMPAMEDFTESERARKLAANLGKVCRQVNLAPLIDYAVVSAAKMGVLEELFRHFQQHHGESNDRRAQAFETFVEKGGLALRQFSIFQLLSEQLASHQWQNWPDALHIPTSEVVNRIASSQRERLRFFQYLQWQCEIQLAATADYARSKGQGLCCDLAVGVAASSSDYWCSQQIFVAGASIGAPPDPFNEAGQAWGLAAPNPRALRAAGYVPFIAWLRANMRHAKALRVDHIMGWQRLFVIPAGASALEGAYLRFPLRDLLAIAALESVRAGCAVIGEDLGTVPAGFRELMSEAGILSTRVLYFEIEGSRFRAPRELPEAASFSVSNHDLATLHGFWTNADIAAKYKAGIFRSANERDAALAQRENDKCLLLEALEREGLLPSGLKVAASTPWCEDIAEAVHVYLSRSSCRIVALQLDDLCGEEQQMNLPGTAAQYPNWRRRMARALEELAANPAIERNLQRVAQARREQS